MHFGRKECILLARDIKKVFSLKNEDVDHENRMNTCNLWKNY